MGQRGISEAMVVRVLSSPSEKEKLFDENNKWLFRLKKDGKILEVVVYWIPKLDRFIVKTAYLL